MLDMMVAPTAQHIGEDDLPWAYGPDGMFVALVRHNRQNNSWRPEKVFNLEEPSPFAADSLHSVESQPSDHSFITSSR